VAADSTDKLGSILCLDDGPVEIIVRGDDDDGVTYVGTIDVAEVVWSGCQNSWEHFGVNTSLLTLDLGAQRQHGFRRRRSHGFSISDCGCASDVVDEYQICWTCHSLAEKAIDGHWK